MKNSTKQLFSGIVFSVFASYANANNDVDTDLIDTEKYTSVQELAFAYAKTNADFFHRLVEKVRPTIESENFKQCLHQILHRTPTNPANNVTSYGQRYAEINMTFTHYDTQRLWLHMVESLANGEDYNNTGDYQTRRQGEKMIEIVKGHPFGAQIIAQHEHQKNALSIKYFDKHFICRF